MNQRWPPLTGSVRTIIDVSVVYTIATKLRRLTPHFLGPTILWTRVKARRRRGEWLDRDSRHLSGVHMQKRTSQFVDTIAVEL